MPIAHIHTYTRTHTRNTCTYICRSKAPVNASSSPMLLLFPTNTGARGPIHIGKTCFHTLNIQRSTTVLVWHNPPLPTGLHTYLGPWITYIGVTQTGAVEACRARGHVCRAHGHAQYTCMCRPTEATPSGSPSDEVLRVHQVQCLPCP